MKEQLIGLAKEKEFKSILAYALDSKRCPSLFYYLWMCELQKWLREKHNLYVTVSPDGKLYEVEVYDHSKGNKINSEYEKFDIKTFEKALEEGLINGLKLIK